MIQKSTATLCLINAILENFPKYLVEIIYKAMTTW